MSSINLYKIDDSKIDSFRTALKEKLSPQDEHITYIDKYKEGEIKFEFAAGHIPKAINVPNETIGTADIPELPDKDQLIMVYCRSGRRSKEASEKLVKLDYTNIVEFGGILDWKGEIITGE